MVKLSSAKHQISNTDKHVKTEGMFFNVADVKM